ncbi:ATP-grasp domain-containing protein [Bifidobacterium xylocopae]|uniref:Uncharacterized protein n=1 Tax=Bifidobacterium xylocopae TaxID=2493119 RepID=A0A366KEE9_9BIFI|nr:ATP-grasp domain-containing protein [Bifidobacterium xylocopae]RBP99493.1 hypothetical protein CRD59_03785 [Bifidobacterium xylocopae]
MKDLERSDAFWIAPGLLIASNTWLKAQDLPTLSPPSPSPHWLERLAQSAPELSGRPVLTATAETIREWTAWPAPLGERPWSQLAQGRVTAFRAARRTLTQLRNDLASAPSDSLIQLSGQVNGIGEEWRVVLSDGQPVAASGYCIHSPAGSQRILSVFDGARFDPANRPAVMAAARRAAQATGLHYATIDLAFVPAGAPQPLADQRPQAWSPVVMEADPLWCAAPYDYGPAGTAAFLDALAESESAPADATDPPYAPDPWMVREFSRRYAAFLPRS